MEHQPRPRRNPWGTPEERREWRRRGKLSASEREALERSEREAFRSSPGFRDMLRRRDEMMASGPSGGRRRRRVSRNPMSSTDWLDLVVPVAALVILVRGGYLRLSGPPANAAPAAPAPASGPQPTGPGPELASWSH